jgi:hypothetical protein
VRKRLATGSPITFATPAKKARVEEIPQQILFLVAAAGSLDERDEWVSREEARPLRQALRNPNITAARTHARSRNSFSQFPRTRSVTA